MNPKGTNMSMTATITKKLEAAFAPEALEVIDESEKHRGHAGWREGGETHFHVVMTSSTFNGKTRLEAQRAVYAALREELAGPVHALTLDLRGTE